MEIPTQHLVVGRDQVIGVHKILPRTNPFPSVLQNPGYLIHLIWWEVVISTPNGDKGRAITFPLISNSMEDLCDGDDALNGLIIFSVVHG